MKLCSFLNSSIHFCTISLQIFFIFADIFKGNALNKYMSSIGIITTYGTFYNLFVNGSDIGLYLGIENISKNLLERNFH